MTEEALAVPHSSRVSFRRIHLTNFLSYRAAVLELGDLVALVGPNASGKSNAVSAMKLLREIPLHGLPTAIARRGGFDQLRHRSQGRPFDPAVRIDFVMRRGDPESFYELKLRAISGKRYEVKSEKGHVCIADQTYSFHSTASSFVAQDEHLSTGPPADFRLPPGQSAVALPATYGAYLVSQALSAIQTVEINPTRVGELQDPSSTREFEPDGSNTASIFAELPANLRRELVDELGAIVPGIDQMETRRYADKVTFAFIQRIGKRERREFLAKQMSDGTLRAFSILLAMLQPARPALMVIEEPEIAIHLGALRTLVDILKQQSPQRQILLTTHSADIIDALDLDSLRVVWFDGGESKIAPVAEHTRGPVKSGLVTPGELLRSDSLDPALV